METKEQRRARTKRERDRLANARKTAHTPEANANRKASLAAMVKLGWVPGKGWPGGVDPRKAHKGNGADGGAGGSAGPHDGGRSVALDLIPDRPPRKKYERKAKPHAAATDDAEYEFLLNVARLVVQRKLGGK